MTIDPKLLDAGEMVLWFGKPNPATYAGRKGAMISLFGFGFFSIAAAWMFVMLRDLSYLVALYGIPFVLFGAIMVLMPLWLYLESRRTVYALTSRRAMIVTTGRFGRRLSVPLSRIAFIDVHPRPDGTGNIFFQETLVSDEDSQTRLQEGFFGIAEVEQAEKVLRNAIDQAAVDLQARGAQST